MLLVCTSTCRDVVGPQIICCLLEEPWGSCLYTMYFFLMVCHFKNISLDPSTKCRLSCRVIPSLIFDVLIWRKISKCLTFSTLFPFPLMGMKWSKLLIVCCGVKFLFIFSLPRPWYAKFSKYVSYKLHLLLEMKLGYWQLCAVRNVSAYWALWNVGPSVFLRVPHVPSSSQTQRLQLAICSFIGTNDEGKYPILSMLPFSYSIINKDTSES